MISSTTSGSARDLALPRRADTRATREPPYISLTPDLGPAKERFIRVFAVATLLYGSYFIVWRWTSTLNLDALWISVPLVVAETIVLFTSFLLVFNVWRLRRREPPPAPAGCTVDVFITTYDEPVEIIRKTALGARAIRYPHRTYLLDDGRRFEVRALARELGIGYIVREGNEHAKAGNLNNALRVTTGEFILQLDADHVPLPSIVDRLLGYMEDPQVAFVQSPQQFYNADSFGSHIDPQTRRFLCDQNVFFSVIQPGKDTHDAAFFCGSGGVLRRAAIEQLGGFSTYTITEDIETSLLLHARGWKSVYHNEALAFGLAPRTATAFHIQRLRWAQGGMQLLRRFNPLTHPGLGWRQRISYLSSVLHPVDGPVRLVFVLTPLLFFITGAFPLRALDGEFVMRFVPFICAFLLLHQLLSRGTGGPIWFLDFGSVARCFTHTISLCAYLSRRRLGFRVTPKGVNGVSWACYAPQLAVMLLTVVAVVWGSLRFRASVIGDGSVGGDLPFMVNLAWAGWNFVIAALVLRASIRSHQRRPDHRFDELLPTRFFVESDGGTASDRIGLTVDLNARGLAFRSIRPVAVGERVTFHLPLSTGTAVVAGRVVYSRVGSAGRLRFHHHGVRFEGVTRPVADAIDTHCTQHGVPLARSRRIDRTDPFTEVGRVFADGRREGRQVVLMPAEITILSDPLARQPGATRLAVLEDSSRSGARFLLDRPLPTGVEVAFRIPDAQIHGTVTTTYCAEVATALGTRYVIGTRRQEGSAPFRIVDNRNEGRMRRVAMLAGIITAAKRFTTVLVLGGMALVAPASAAAQLTHGYLTGVERDSDGQLLVLLGGWIGRPVTGWTPTAGAIAYRLSYDAGPASSVVWAVNPFLGVRHQGAHGGLQAAAGYSFRSTDGQAAEQAGRQRVSSGVTTSVQGDYGAGGPRVVSAIVNYAWDDDGYLWSRARAAQRVSGGGRVAAGAELTLQGNGSYRAYEAGPILEWKAAPGVAIVAGAGWRRAVVRDVSSRDLGYARLELVIVR